MHILVTCAGHYKMSADRPALISASATAGISAVKIRFAINVVGELYLHKLGCCAFGLLFLDRHVKDTALFKAAWVIRSRAMTFLHLVVPASRSFGDGIFETALHQSTWIRVVMRTLYKHRFETLAARQY